jgi:lipoprotein-anchoring transpeptidase ErfK/SrfK
MAGMAARAGGSMRRRARLALLAIATVALATACAPGATWRGPGDDDGPSTPAAPSLSLVFSHAEGEADVSPGKPVIIQAFGGTIETVSLTSNIGEVAGELSADGTLWRSAQDLEYGKQYTLTVTGLGGDGQAVEETRTFKTVSVGHGMYWNVYFVPHPWFGEGLDGGTFGVGQPIVAEFDDAVDRAVAEATLTVTTDPPVQGAWHWISDREAHWRPQQYWTPGTKVTVSANILGVALTSPVGGRVLHGQENKTATFTIGDAKIAKVDNHTKQMVIYVNGQQVKTMPVSLGRESGYRATNGQWYDWRTPSGIMVVTEQHDPVVMRPDLPKDDPEYYEETIPLASRITDSGIYVHAAPWSVWAQGSQNVSHGCINVSTENAQWFFENFGPGDVVEIVNTGVQVSPRDGLGDWNVPWEEWVAGSAR